MANVTNIYNPVVDFLLDEDSDLMIVDGDFYIGPSDQQHATLILNTTVGSWNQFPLVGVGIQYYQASAGQTALLQRNVYVQFQVDGYNIDRLLTNTTPDNKYTIYLSANRIKQ